MSQTQIALKIELLSYWHAGSGAGRSAYLDTLIRKDRSGLPFLPGRTVKGLLREALQNCEDVGQVNSGRTNELFGTPTRKGYSDSSRPGCLSFQNATLSPSEHDWLSGKSEQRIGARMALYDRFSSTELNDQGIADEHSLRTIELCVPLTLQTIIAGPNDDRNRWIDYLAKACVLFRSLGSHRSRGLGRCRVTISQNS